MKIKQLMVSVVLLLGGGGVHAQVVFRSLEEVWKYADEHSVAMRVARYEADKAGYAKKQAYGALLPQVNATGGYTDNLSLQTTLIPADIFGGPAGSFRALNFGQQFVYSGGINAQMNILNLQNWYNARIAQQTEAMSRDSIASTRKNMYQQVATQYYSYLLMQEAARLAALTASIADSVYQSSANKYSEGTINEANVDVSKLNLERARMNYTSATYQAQTAKNNIRALLGLTLKDSLSFIASLEKVNADVPGAFNEDPAIRLAADRAQISLSQYHLANSSFAPTINIVYNYTTQRYDKKFEPFTNATGVAAWFPAQYWSLQAGIPLFTGGGHYFQSRKARLNCSESMLLLENARSQSAINDENLRLGYMKAAAVLEKAGSVMALSFDNYRHISYRYEAGIEPLDARLNAFRDYIDYQNQYLNSLMDMLVQLYQVKIREQVF